MTTEDFEPFAQLVSGPSLDTTRVAFTIHQQHADLGLVDMRGRMYDPPAARFMTRDPEKQRRYWSHGLNRYRYVFDGPVNATNPTGFVAAPCPLRTTAQRCQDMYTSQMWARLLFLSAAALAAGCAGTDRGPSVCWFRGSVSGAVNEDLTRREADCGARGGSGRAEPYWQLRGSDVGMLLLEVQGLSRGAAASNLSAVAYVGRFAEPRWRADGCLVDITSNEFDDLGDDIFRIEGNGSCPSPAQPEPGLAATPLVLSAFEFMGIAILP